MGNRAIFAVRSFPGSDGNAPLYTVSSNAIVPPTVSPTIYNRVYRCFFNKISFHNDLRIKSICQIIVKTSFVLCFYAPRLSITIVACLQ